MKNIIQRIESKTEVISQKTKHKKQRKNKKKIKDQST